MHNQDLGILAGLKIYFDRTVQHEQRNKLSEIAKNAGARIVAREPKPDNDAVQSDAEVIQSKPDFQYTYMILHHSDKPTKMVKQGKVGTAPVDWLLDSLLYFRVQDL
jgi:hypothetical protein